ncbi:MAG: L-threonylcarbamoyladenylate synthase [Alkalispirochaetaceae bacterium]
MDQHGPLQREQLPDIKEAARLLREGGVVVFPTETVYGVGADARNSDACRRIYEAKGRPADNPLIVHIASISQLRELTGGNPPEAAVRALELFAPGPITVVVRHNGSISPVATTGLETVAVRIPSHTVALALLEEAAIPVAAPSANRSGRPSPTTHPMALGAMEGRVDAILDGGPCSVGVESTILDCTTTPQRILRPGGVTLEMLLAAGFDVAALRNSGEKRPEPAGESMKGGEAPTETADSSLSEYRAPGSRYRHYTPEAVVHLLEEGDSEGRGNGFLEGAEPRTVGLLGTASAIDSLALSVAAKAALLETVSFESLEAYARGMFSSFYAFDQAGCRAIIAILPPAEGVGVAVRDRLSRAGSAL